MITDDRPIENQTSNVEASNLANTSQQQAENEQSNSESLNENQSDNIENSVQMDVNEGKLFNTM